MTPSKKIGKVTGETGAADLKHSQSYIALIKAKTVCNFGLSECNRVKPLIHNDATIC